MPEILLEAPVVPTCLVLQQFYETDTMSCPLEGEEAGLTEVQGMQLLTLC